MSSLDLKRFKEWWPDYDPDDQKQPTALCAKCRKDLSKVALKQMSKDQLPKPNFPPGDFGGLTGRQLKDKRDCMCPTICKMARENAHTVGNTVAAKPFAKGPQPSVPTPVQTVSITCDICGQKVGRGIPHPCGAKGKRQTAFKLLEGDQKGSEIVASRAIRAAVAAAPSTSTNVTLQTGGGGKVMTVPMPQKRVSKALFPNQPIPAEEFHKMTTARGLSNALSDALAQDLRVLKGRDFFEPNTRERMRQLNKRLAHLYKAKKVMIDSTDPSEEVDENGKVERWLFYCDEVPELAELVGKERGYHPQTKVMNKVGFDAGGTWLKLCLNSIKVEDDFSSPVARKTRSSYSDGVAPNKLLDSGVKKLIPLAFIQNAKESYHNLELIVREVRLNRIEYDPAFDYKLGLTFMGLGTAASAYPCLYCTMRKDEFKHPELMFGCGKLRTFKDIKNLAAQYLAAAQAHKGKNKLSSKEYNSCEHPPLFDPEFLNVDTKLVIEYIPPMELHILLGLGNDVFKVIRDIMVGLGWAKTLERWVKHLGIKLDDYHGGRFNGNMTELMLQGSNVLRTLLGRDLKLQKAARIPLLLQVVDQIEEVRQGCFGQTLDSDFEKEIRILGKLWLKAGLSFTSKAHVLFAHVAQFLQFKNPQNGPKRGLGFWSEQASETVHSDFEKFWQQGYKRVLGLDANYRDKSLECIIAYASKHI